MKAGPVRHRVLGIGREGGFLSELDPLLESCNSELYLAPAPESGLQMIQSLGPVDLVIVEYPLKGLTLDDFRIEVGRSSPGPLRVAVLGRSADMEGLRTEDDLILLPFERSVEEVGESLWGLLERAPRVSVQLMVRVEMDSGDRKILRLAQTENISKTGMLLRTKEELPEETTVGFEFFLPDDSHPITGAASVVRTTGAQDGSHHGVAIRFQSLLGSDQLRLESYLASVADDA